MDSTTMMFYAFKLIGLLTPVIAIAAAINFSDDLIRILYKAVGVRRD